MKVLNLLFNNLTYRFYNLTLSSVIMMISGALIALAGASTFIRPLSRTLRLGLTSTLAIGLLLIGIGNILCGITNGFMDFSPSGRLFRRAGIMAYIIGFLLFAYNIRRFI